MKRTYNQPACIVAWLGTIQMIAESVRIDDGQTITNADEILVGEFSSTLDVNLWNDEW